MVTGEPELLDVTVLREATMAGPKQLLQGPSLSPGPPKKLSGGVVMVPSFDGPAVQAGVKTGAATMPHMSIDWIWVVPC